MSMDKISLEEYHVSKELGFLLESPLEYLPEYFQPWNSLARRMPELVTTKELRDTVSEMALLDYTKLEGHRQYRLAHLQLSIIAAGYIWQEGDKGAAKSKTGFLEVEPQEPLMQGVSVGDYLLCQYAANKRKMQYVGEVLPRNLSIPWCGVSSYLGLQPVLCHASFVLANWKYIDEKRTLRSLYKLPGGDEADWFITVTAQIELDFAAGLKNLMLALHHADTGNLDDLAQSLTQATDTVNTMRRTLSTMHDRLSAETFYDRMRPFLTGWGGDGSPLPDGVIYEGISDTSAKMTGGSAAQSSTLQCIDAVLGITHTQEIHAFLSNMRHYMPPAHREFLAMIEEHSRVKSVVEICDCEKLKAAYNQCVKAVIEFRSYHIQIVTKYIVLMANRECRNKDYEALATRGTGGSSILPFLKSLRTTTSACLTPDSSIRDQVIGD